MLSESGAVWTLEFDDTGGRWIQNTYFYQPFTKSEKGRRKKTNGKVKSCAVRFSTQQFSFSESKSQLLITIKTWTKTQVVKLKCNYSHLKVNTRISDNVTRDGHPTNIAFLRPIFDDFKSQYSNMSANIFPSWQQVAERPLVDKLYTMSTLITWWKGVSPFSSFFRFPLITHYKQCLLNVHYHWLHCTLNCTLQLIYLCIFSLYY